MTTCNYCGAGPFDETQSCLRCGSDLKSRGWQEPEGHPIDLGLALRKHPRLIHGVARCVRTGLLLSGGCLAWITAVLIWVFLFGDYLRIDSGMLRIVPGSMLIGLVHVSGLFLASGLAIGFGAWLFAEAVIPKSQVDKRQIT